MRVTTGIAGGRSLVVPKSELRPTQDKVRQALFSSLGGSVPGCRFLDLFAGSGSVGIEAWSRGAAFACCVEKDFKAVEAMEKNRAALRIPADALQIVKADVTKFLAGYRGEAFDFVFADPPYQRTAGFAPTLRRAKEDRGQKSEVRGQRSETEGRWSENVLAAIAAGSILKADGLLIFEQGEDEAVHEAPGWGVIQVRDYGAARLVFYRKAT